MNRKEMMINLRNKRYSCQKIGEIFHISRQRVHAIITDYTSPSERERNPTTFIPVNWKPPKKQLKNDVYRRGMGGRDVLSEIVRKRDNWTCQICGKIWIKGQRRFDVHHLDKDCENILTCENYKRFDRMITLCHKCHLNLGHIKSKKKRI